MTPTFKSILGIRFFNGDLADLLARCDGNFIVVPSAPTLVELPTNASYREAVEKSDFAIADSGYMVFLWRVFTGEHLIRISGLKFLRGLIFGGQLSGPGISFWIMPTHSAMEANVSWLARNGVPVTADDCFVAPIYPAGPLDDPQLLRIIEERKPRYIIINIGGGVQERLGYYLRKNLSYRPAILCVGAAIAFLTGLQATIPVWADAYYLGWFLRCLQAPGQFVPRYWKALRLIFLLARYRERSVVGHSS